MLNAGAAIYVGAGVESLEQGVRRAEQAIDSGAALACAGSLRGPDAGAGALNTLERIVAQTRLEVRASAERARAASLARARRHRGPISGRSARRWPGRGCR